MTTDCWKEFAKEKPPVGQLVLFSSDQRHIRVQEYQGWNVEGFYRWWQLWSDPPQPDPFEQWHQAWTTAEDPLLKETRRAAWMAGVKWAREHPEVK